MGRRIPVASRRVPVALWLLAFAGTAAWFPSPWDSRPVSRSALGDEAPTTALPRALSLPAGGPETTRFALGLETSWSSKDHRLRSLRDEASLEGELEVTVGLESAGLAPVTIRARSFEVKRRKRARFAGVFSDSEEDARGDARSRGADDAPPPWTVLVSPRGLVHSPEAAAVGSAPARWPRARAISATM